MSGQDKRTRARERVRQIACNLGSSAARGVSAANPEAFHARNAETVPSGPPLDLKEAPNTGAFFLCLKKCRDQSKQFTLTPGVVK